MRKPKPILVPILDCDIEYFCGYECGKVARYYYVNSHQVIKYCCNKYINKCPNVYKKQHNIVQRSLMSKTKKLQYKLGLVVNPMLGIKRSKDVCRKISKTRRKLGLGIGDTNPNWRGGKIEPGVRKLEMSRYKYKKWRRRVLKRDKYTCTKCGSIAKLEANHIKPWAYYPELRYKVSNGETLCKKCHCKEMKKVFKWRAIAIKEGRLIQRTAR